MNKIRSQPAVSVDSLPQPRKIALVVRYFCRPLQKRGRNMQGIKRLFAAAAIMAVAAALGGCLHGHHAKQVTHKPMKLGAADTVIEQVRV